MREMAAAAFELSSASLQPCCRDKLLVDYSGELRSIELYMGLEIFGTLA